MLALLLLVLLIGASASLRPLRPLREIRYVAERDRRVRSFAACISESCNAFRVNHQEAQYMGCVENCEETHSSVNQMVRRNRRHQ